MGWQLVLSMYFVATLSNENQSVFDRNFVLGASRAGLGTSSAAPGKLLGPLGALWDRVGVVLGRSWTLFGPLGMLLGGSWAS